MTFKVIGHRGKGPTSNQPFIYEGQEPENTLPAFRKAFLEGADGIEFDVSISKDRKIMVIHDDELNRNVVGADRDLNNLGYTQDYTVDELKYFDVGNGEKIPTLEETLDLVVEMNEPYRARTGKDLIINIELKGDDVVEETYNTMMKYVSEGKLNKESFIYNTFKWDRLHQMRELDKEVKLVPNVKTTQFFGIENVIMPGFMVSEDTDYSDDFSETLQTLHNEIGCHALDCVVYDVRPELIDLCQQNGIGLYVSTSNLRTNTNSMIPVLKDLNDYSTRLPVTFFKADDPKSAIHLRDVLEAGTDVTLDQPLMLPKPSTAGLNAKAAPL